ncbi:ATP-binding protein [Lysinibacillus irui]|uniref:ATP-binding protein n=2 Tax=Lysinibacillus TaxID=400634 RepID=A0AAJ5RN22_9BACI|nr:MULTISPECIES: ATP-binding protein [Lysinibacillus]WDV08956.1 ATP-binding protein [Lysinibacillus irui]
MKVYSLSGPSGTGKSTSALAFAHKLGVEAIIDDGLLIINGVKVAGVSAKFEKNTITAVRRAIFTEQEHREAVKKALASYKVEAILLIGTSTKMTKSIAKQLELGPIEHYYQVEDVRSLKEIQKARFIRQTQGKHVMPIPYRQVEQNFFKRLVQKGMEIFSSKREKIGETTIVRPDFQREYIEISKHVYVDLLTYCCNQQAIVQKVEHAQFVLGDQAEAILTIQVKLPIDYPLAAHVLELQRAVQESFYLHFGYELDAIHVQVKVALQKKKS